MRSPDSRVRGAATTPAAHHESTRNGWLSEASGAFGDLGILIPFVTAYLAIVGMAPQAVLVPIGLASIAAGLWFRTPFPVQPMKLIGASVILYAQAGITITPEVVVAAGLFTGVVWLALGLTGLAERFSAWIPREALLGVVMGLGFGFMLEGLRTMSAQPWGGAATLAIALVLLSRPAIPTMLVLLAGGVLASVFAGASAALGALAVPAFTLPAFAWPTLSWRALELGVLLLALPQLPLTLGNALVAVHAETRRLFPRHEVGEREIALSTGAMNVVGSAIGGVPMCHGAGGLAAHVAFGARTGGSVVILGLLLLALGLCFAQAVTTLFGLLPPQVLGAVLAATALQLGAAQLRGGAQPLTQAERALLAATAALSVWHVGAGLAVGIVLQQALRARSRRVTR